MAMTINENPMNPVPLWDSKSKWQCNQKTFHDAMAWPVVQNGVLPLIALTVHGDMPSGTNRSTSLKISNHNIATFNRSYVGDSNSVDGTATLVLTGTANRGELNPPNPEPQVTIIPQANGLYKMTLDNFDIVKTPNGSDLFTYDEIVYGSDIFSVVVGQVTYPFKMSNVNINYHSSKTVVVNLRKFDNNTSVYSTTQTLQIDGCLPYYNSDRCGQCWLGGQTVKSVADGVYYMDVVLDELDDVHYYSEPFLWLTNVSNFTLVTYRRSDAVVTRNNCIVFTDRSGTARSLSMYIQNVEQKPPYQFDAEVTDIDGRKFAEKQVSYYNKRLSFHCYEAFLEAIRLLWHCDIRYMGSRRIDYMEPPEVDWNTDNHLCDVVLAMSNYDDVIQTNGTASSYYDSSDSSHQSYDASFDASFD